MALITDVTLGAVKDKMALRNQKLSAIANLFDVSPWDVIRMDVRNGNASNYAIGTELSCKYTYNGTEYDFPWIVLDNNRNCTWEDGTTHPGLWLGSKYATAESMVFDAQEGIAATEATAESGVYYCGVSGTTYTMLNLSAGDTIPYGSYDSVLKGSINHNGVYKGGYNRYRDSAMRQWLNSSGNAGSWWEATHFGDNAPSNHGSVKGFMAGLDADFLAVIKPVKIQVAANTVTDGGATDVMYDRFFLQSLEEVYGVAQVTTVEGPYFPYWKTATGLSEPSNGTSSSGLTVRTFKKCSDPTGNTSATNLRSAGKGASYTVWGFYSPGYLTSNNASMSRTLAPACVIS